jgi:hypothetical protein
MSLLLARDAGSQRFGSHKSHQCKKLPGSPSLDDLTLMQANPSSSFRPPERVDCCQWYKAEVEAEAALSVL